MRRTNDCAQYFMNLGYSLSNANRALSTKDQARFIQKWVEVGLN